MKRTSSARAGITGAAIILTLILAGCGGGSSTPSGDATVGVTAAATGGATTDATAAPSILASDDFCAMAVDAIAAADDLAAGTNELNTAMSTNDVEALHSAGHAILDHSDQATAFYAVGATVADDQATKDAFDGMTTFVADYSVRMGQAAVDATSVPAFMTAVTSIIADPATTPLLTSTGEWATTVKDFATQHCSLI